MPSNANYAEQVAQNLNALLKEYESRAGDGAYSLDDRHRYLECARELKPFVEKLHVNEFHANTERFNKVVENYRSLSEDVKSKIAKLEAIVSALQTALELVAVLDDALEITAGLSKSL